MDAILAAIAISGMIGVLIGSFMNNIFGGKRSSIGVHYRDGRIMPFWSGTVYFAMMTCFAGSATTALSALMVSAFSGVQALILSFIGVSLMLQSSSYSQ